MYQSRDEAIGQVVWRLLKGQESAGAVVCVQWDGTGVVLLGADDQDPVLVSRDGQIVTESVDTAMPAA